MEIAGHDINEFQAANQALVDGMVGAIEKLLEACPDTNPALVQGVRDLAASLAIKQTAYRETMDALIEIKKRNMQLEQQVAKYKRSQGTVNLN